jgi:hypothetical protein
MAGRLLSVGRRLLAVIAGAGSFTHVRDTAAQYGQILGLPSPVIRSSPAQAALQLTNLPTWLWINPAEWVPESQTATVPGESATATATPVSVTWHPGDGSTVTCQGRAPRTRAPTIPRRRRRTAGTPTLALAPGCRAALSGRRPRSPGTSPGGGPGAAGGVLAPLFTTAAAAFRVAESQALDASGT